MNNNSLSVFLTVVEEMSFTKAAQKLYITQQSLSGHIKRIEETYGVRLFDRKPRLRLTPEGEAMAFYARQMVRAERNLTDRFADISRNAGGYLDIGMSQQRSSAFFEGFWMRFHPAYPNIDVRLTAENTQGLLGDLMQGEINLMVGINVAQAPRLEIEQLTTETMRCVVSGKLMRKYFPDTHESILAHASKKGMPPEKLAMLPLMVMPEGNRLRVTMDSMFQRAGVMPHIILESSQQDLSLRIALKGEAAAAISPIVLYSYYREKGRLPKDVYSFRLEEAVENRVSLVSRTDAPKHSFLDAAKQAIREEYDVYNKTMKEAGL